jgi:hypothetical protein
MTRTIQTTKRMHERAPDAEPGTPYLDLAGEALLAGMTHAQVVAQLVGRIRRDQGYLAYRRASGRRTRYDEQVTADLRALALAACWLSDSSTGLHSSGQPEVSAQMRRAPAADRARR